MVKADFNVHWATFSRARAIFPTLHLMLSPEAISDRGRTQLIGVTAQEPTLVRRCVLMLVGRSWSR